jgi:4,5-DOPA dioxygenase extradiol
VTRPTAPLLPAGFVAHGAPFLAVNAARGAPLRAWAASLPRPRAFLFVSAHFERAPLTIGAETARELLYDFTGFPPELYRVRYPAPGAPELAERVAALLAHLAPLRSERPLDHGVWTPLVHLAPAADVPVLELSMPRPWSARELFELGRALAPLRAEGVWILGSGNLVHNLGRLDPDEAPPPAWAVEFDAWIADVLRRRDWDALIGYRERAPALRLAHPTEEHLRPLLVAAGAGADGPVSFPVEGWEWGSLSRRCVQLG